MGAHDYELPGMWEEADLFGGATDARDEELERLRVELAEAGRLRSVAVDRLTALAEDYNDLDNRMSRIVHRQQEYLREANSERDALKATVKRVRALAERWSRIQIMSAPAMDIIAALAAPSDEKETP